MMKTLLPALRKRSARPRPIPSLPPVIRTFAFERSSEFVDIIRILAFSTRQFAGGFVRAWPEPALPWPSKTTFDVFTRVGPDNSLERFTERSVGLVTDRPSNVYELFVTLL